MSDEQMMEIIRLLGLDNKVSSNGLTQECKHRDVAKDDNEFYVCMTCHEELRYNPNRPPPDRAKLYSMMKMQRRSQSRVKNLTKWLDGCNIPFEELLLIEFFDFVHKYEELFPERKNLISKEYILFHLLRRIDYQVPPLKLPKMKKTLDQNEEICRTVFESLNWNFFPISKCGHR